MTTLTIQTKGDPVMRLQRDSRDLQKAADFAGRSATRRLTGIGRRALVEATGIKRASANRRVRQYRNKTWFGTVPVVATAPYIQTTRARQGRRGVLVDGQPVEGAFVQTSGRYRGIPFRRGDDGRLVVIRRDIAEQAQQAFDETSAQTDEVVADELDKAVGRTLARAG